jgi:transposase
MKAYSMDLRVRVLADSERGMKTRAVAAKYSVSESWVRHLKRRARAGEVAPRPPKNHRAGFRDRHADRLRAAVAGNPDRTLAELRDHLGVRVSLATLWQALTDLKISWKKSRTGRPSGTAPTSPPRGPSGGPARPGSTRRGSSSSMRRG